MGVSALHAKNYWRKVFVSVADGHFDEEDFEKWFWRATNTKYMRVEPFAHQDKPGTKAHFRHALNEALSIMLEACAREEFGKAAPVRQARKQKTSRK